MNALKEKIEDLYYENGCAMAILAIIFIVIPICIISLLLGLSIKVLISALIIKLLSLCFGFVFRWLYAITAGLIWFFLTGSFKTIINVRRDD